MLSWLRTLYTRLHNSENARAVLFFADALGKLAIFAAILTFIIEYPDRARERHYRAWGIINGAREHPGDAGRSIALDVLVQEHVEVRDLDLTNANLSNRHFRSAILPGAIFRNESQLANNTFDRVDFSCDWGFHPKEYPYFKLCWSTNLDRARFQVELITRVTLSDASLNFAVFGGISGSTQERISAILTLSHFDRANMKEAVFRNIMIQKNSFAQSKMQGVRWEAVTIRGNSFVGADLSASRWFDVKLEADDNGNIPNFTDAYLIDVVIGDRAAPAEIHILSEDTDTELLKNAILCRTHFSQNIVSNRDCAMSAVQSRAPG
jgi:uncharacterized protein YjbI with pentapeptide repeats